MRTQHNSFSGVIHLRGYYHPTASPTAFIERRHPERSVGSASGADA